TGGWRWAASVSALIVTLFTEPTERAKAMGVFGFVAAGGRTIGVPLGGILTDALSWHWIFLANVPIGIAVLVLARLVLLGGHIAPPSRRLDVVGSRRERRHHSCRSACSACETSRRRTWLAFCWRRRCSRGSSSPPSTSSSCSATARCRSASPSC